MGGPRAPIALMNVGAAGQFFVRGCQHTLDEQPVIGATAGGSGRTPAESARRCRRRMSRASQAWRGRGVGARPELGPTWECGKSTKNCHILLPDDLGSDRHRETGRYFLAWTTMAFSILA